jgi:hypothetical protein
VEPSTQTAIRLKDSPFEQRGRRPRADCRAYDSKAQAVGHGVGEKIERVRLEGLRPCKVARRHFGKEHRAVDGDDGPEHTLVARVQPVKHGHAAMTAAGFIRAAACGRGCLHGGLFGKLQGRWGTVGLGGTANMTESAVNIPLIAAIAAVVTVFLRGLAIE